MTQILAAIIAMFSVFGDVDTPVVISYDTDNVATLVGTWQYVSVESGHVGMFDVHQGDDDVLWYVLYDDNYGPSTELPPLRMQSTNGLSFKTFSEDGTYIGHMVFVDQRPSGDWNVMLVIAERTLPLILHKLEKVPEHQERYQIG